MRDIFTLLNELHTDGTLTLYQTDALYHACCAHINYGILPSAETFALPSGYYVPFLECVKYLWDHYVASPMEIEEIRMEWAMQDEDSSLSYSDSTRSLESGGTSLSDFLEVDPQLDDVECEELIRHWFDLDDLGN